MFVFDNFTISDQLALIWACISNLVQNMQRVNSKFIKIQIEETHMDNQISDKNTD